ncbi:Olfactory receptor 51A4 [Heterocephalus glaber]|uniref:Olfactory receptor 51A4 n=1 Tax=Heterocephalus glaber TaxID=10181 RepID=G5B9H4_HETGA|nr:Olfactory receptor 51A4 [Heterocephalus glaber]
MSNFNTSEAGISTFYLVGIPDVMKLTCSDNRVSVVYGFYVVVSTTLDLVFIAFSYIMILKTVLGIATPENSSRPSTPASLTSVLLSAAMLHRFSRDVSAMTHVLMADIFLSVPPLMNPIVYCMKTH